MLCFWGGRGGGSNLRRVLLFCNNLNFAGYIVAATVVSSWLATMYPTDERGGGAHGGATIFCSFVAWISGCGWVHLTVICAVGLLALALAVAQCESFLFPPKDSHHCFDSFQRGRRTCRGWMTESCSWKRRGIIFACSESDFLFFWCFFSGEAELFWSWCALACTDSNPVRLK